MAKLDKRKLLGLQWNSFETYPKNGEKIVLHIEGKVVKENKILHDFRQMRFDAYAFNPKRYIPQNDSRRVAWRFSWLPYAETLKA